MTYEKNASICWSQEGNSVKVFKRKDDFNEIDEN